MKNVLILGATGHIGKLTVGMLNNQATVHQTLYVRSPEKLSVDETEGSTVIQGDVLDTKKLSQTIKKQNIGIVVASLSGDLLSNAKSIVEAMKGTNVYRVMWVTGLGIHHEVPGEVGKMLEYYANKYPEFIQAADTIAESGVAYTLIRVAKLIDGPETEYFLQKEGEEIHSNDTTMACVAKFITDMVTDENGFGENESLGITI